MEAVANYAPGGKFYPTIFGGRINESALPYKKIAQMFLNANRFEYAITQVFSNLRWADDTHNYFHAGVGTDMADLIDENKNMIDCKVYYNYGSLLKNTIDLFCDKTQEDAVWRKRINKLFHSGCNMLFAYDNASKKLYAINRPLEPLTKEEAAQFIHEIDIAVPNIEAADCEYVVEWNKPFELKHLK